MGTTRTSPATSAHIASARVGWPDRTRVGHPHVEHVIDTEVRVYEQICSLGVTALRQNPRDATISLNRFSVGVMLGVDGATPVTRGRTTCVLECAAHRTRDRDIHAAITRSVVGRRVAGH